MTFPGQWDNDPPTPALPCIRQLEAEYNRAFELRYQAREQLRKANECYEKAENAYITHPDFAEHVKR